MVGFIDDTGFGWRPPVVCFKGGGGSSSPPPPPDPAATARAQGAANREAAIAQAELNMINQNTPFGSLSFEQTGESEEGNPLYTATQTLSPEQQAIQDQNNQAALTFGQTANQQLNAVSGTLSQPLDYSGLGPAPTLNEATRQSVADSMMARIDPRFEEDRQRLDTQLANQGIVPGTVAYDRAIDELNRQRTDARLAVDSAALGQASQLYGLEAAQRNQGINELIQQRSVPLNELSAMLTGSQVQAPTFVNPPQTAISAPDVLGATYGSYNGQLNAYNAAQQRAAANTQGLYSLLGAGLNAGATAYAFSDRRLKRDIQRVGTLNSMGVYAFRYVWGGPQMIGLMADEVRRVKPHAVKRIGGYDAVNYAEALA